MRPEMAAKFRDFRWFAERFFHIRDIDSNVVPFRLNALQEKLHEAFTGADDVLKARKGGVSTYFVLRQLHRCLTRPQTRALILAHEHRSSLELFDIAKLAYDHLPYAIQPGLEVDNRHEMKFRGLGSKLEAQTAKNLQIGRGGTIDSLHCSEIAFWDDPQKTLAAVAASLGGDPEVLRESTASGAGNYWHREWLAAKNRQSTYRPHFFPWWVTPKYAVAVPESVPDPDEFDADGTPRWSGDPNEGFAFSDREVALGLTPPQARWRRRAVRKFKGEFPQEYAEDDATCFLTSGNSVFDNPAILRMYEALLAADLKPAHVPELGLAVYHRFKQSRWPFLEFVIGADTSEGLASDDGSHGDYSAAYVCERRSGIQVASVHGLWEPYEFAHVLAKVAAMYTTAQGRPLLGVERNEYGHATLNELRNHIRYPNLYHVAEYDNEKRQAVRRVGWRTDAKSRPVMIQDLVKAVNTGTLRVNDTEFLAECMTFVKNRRGRPEAQRGCHDDRVMAQAVAWQMVQMSQGAPLMGTNFT